MKKLLIAFSVMAAITAQGQNPFAEYGYEPKIATYSQGQFNEFFDQDTIVQIGSVLFNTNTNEIVAFVEVDTLYSEATLEPDIVSRWMSPDPLAAKYTSLSPYNFVGNNPIIFVDPDGKSIKPSDTRAQGQLVQAFNYYFGSLPQVQAHIQYREIGKTDDGTPVMAYTYDGFIDGVPKLTISQAKKAIWNSGMTKKDKLTAMAYLTALQQTNIIEVQHPSNDNEKIPPAVLSGSDELKQAKNAYNVALGIQNGTGTPIPESVNQATTGSVNGAPGFQSFPNENKVNVTGSANEEIPVQGVYIISSGTNASANEQIQNVSNMILNATQGATYSEAGPQKNTRTDHAIDQNGTVLTPRTRRTD